MVTMWSLAICGFANHKQSLVLSSGGGGNRSDVSTPDSDDSRTVSRTGTARDTAKKNDENGLGRNLMTMSQIPDVNRELAEVGAVQALFALVKNEWGRA
jgi:hypothetical protein